MKKFFTCVDNFLSDVDCQQYIDIYNENLSLSFIYNDTYPLQIRSDITVQNVCSYFRINNKLDNYEIVKREKGSFMENHYDKGDTLGFIIYLNDNYKGGETVLENETSISPKKGRILLFSNGQILHKVQEITEGTRYILAGWFI